MNINTKSTLYIVATPIGNRQDITLRAIEILKAVDLIAAEDTRHSAPLLQHLGINKPLLAFHDHNEKQAWDKVITKLKEGKSVALISDAGTPLISDPGYYLVHEAHQLGFKVEPIPGACAAIAALSASGLPTDRFVFEGFLPAKSQARQHKLSSFLNEVRTIVFYESPHRILDSISDMQIVFGSDRKLVIARELTKMFETIFSGTTAEVLAWMQADANQQRGEFVVMVGGVEKTDEQLEMSSADEMLKLLLAELPVKKAAEIAAKLTGKRKNALYQRALELVG